MDKRLNKSFIDFITSYTTAVAAIFKGPVFSVIFMVYKRLKNSFSNFVSSSSTVALTFSRGSIFAAISRESKTRNVLHGTYV